MTIIHMVTTAIRIWGLFIFNERTEHSHSVRIFVIHRVTIFIRLMSVVNKFRAILVDLESQCVSSRSRRQHFIISWLNKCEHLFGMHSMRTHTKHTLLYSICPFDMIYAHIMRSCLWVFGNLAAPLPACPQRNHVIINIKCGAYYFGSLSAGYNYTHPFMYCITTLCHGDVEWHSFSLRFRSSSFFSLKISQTIRCVCVLWHFHYAIKLGQRAEFDFSPHDLCALAMHTAYTAV